LIDRDLDLVSPFLRQRTYAGALDEEFGINSSLVKLPSKFIVKKNEEEGEDWEKVDLDETENEENEKMTVCNLSKDVVFAGLGHLSFLGVGCKTKEFGAQLKNLAESLDAKVT
jgi:hypothetical protein